jgi:DNA-binding transcriptional MerR regulator
MAKRRSKGAYMISAVAEMYGIHPQTLRLYEREGLLKPSRTEGNTRLYTDEDLQRLEFILSLARDLGVNIEKEMLARSQAETDASRGAIIPIRRTAAPPGMAPARDRKR